MKKKWTALLLSVVVLFGLAVPAFADDFADSSVGGNPEDITQLAFSQSSYSVPKDSTFDLKDVLTAYCGNKTICQFPTYEFSGDETSLAISVSRDGIVTAWEDSGSATITVEEITSGKKASCRVVATKSGSTTASFKFDPASYVLYTGAAPAEQTPLRILPVNGKFTDTQRQAIISGVEAGFDKSGLEFGMEKVLDEDEDGAIVFRPTSEITNVNAGVTVYVSAQMREGSTAVTTRTIRVAVREGSAAGRISNKGPIKLEIGKTADLNDYITYNSSASYGKECSYYLDVFSSSYDTYDYAVLGADGHTIKGVAVGKLVAVASLISDPSVTTTIRVEVVPKGGASSGSTTSGDMSISPASGSIRVGGTLLLTAKNVSADQDVSWRISDDSVASLTISSGKATVTGLKVGTVTITAEVDGVEIGSSRVTVVNQAAPTTSEDESLDGSGSSSLPPPPIVTNPATGDSWFSHLF